MSIIPSLVHQLHHFSRGVGQPPRQSYCTTCISAGVVCWGDIWSIHLQNVHWVKTFLTGYAIAKHGDSMDNIGMCLTWCVYIVYVCPVHSTMINVWAASWFHIMCICPQCVYTIMCMFLTYPTYACVWGQCPNTMSQHETTHNIGICFNWHLLIGGTKQCSHMTYCPRYRSRSRAWSSSLDDLPGSWGLDPQNDQRQNHEES